MKQKHHYLKLTAIENKRAQAKKETNEMKKKKFLRRKRIEREN